MNTDQPSQPGLVLVTGPPGTGKSTLAELAATRLEAPVLAWDWTMAAITWCEPLQAALRSLDWPDYRRVGWSILWNLAEAQLRAGRSVVDTSEDPDLAPLVEQIAICAGR